VTLHEVTVDAVADAQRALDVHHVARLEHAEVGLRKGLRDDVEREEPARELRDREAHAVDRDAVAALGVGPVDGKVEPAEAGPVGDGRDADGSFDNSGEHRVKHRRGRGADKPRVRAKTAK